MLSISLSLTFSLCPSQWHRAGVSSFLLAMPVRVYLFFAAAATTTFHLNYIKKKNISIHKRKTSALRSNEYENV